MKISDVEKYIDNLKQQMQIQKTVKDTMRFPSRDLAQLFEKFAEPRELTNGNIVSRELSTGNFSADIYFRIVTIGSIRSNFKEHFLDLFLSQENLDGEKIKELSKEEKKEYYDIQKARVHVQSLIKMMGNDMTILATASKGKEGWLGNLIISSKRIGEAFVYPLQQAKKSILGR